MGCDIHMVVERRVNGGRWIGLHAAPSLKHVYAGANDFGLVLARRRNYALFAAMASVRGVSQEGHKPRGLPTDASELAAHLANEFGSDGHSHSHSHSWLPLADAVELYIRYAHKVEAVRMRIEEGHTEDFVQSSFSSMLFDVDPSEEVGWDHYRLVFWFDN